MSDWVWQVICEVSVRLLQLVWPGWPSLLLCFCCLWLSSEPWLVLRRYPALWLVSGWWPVLCMRWCQDFFTFPKTNVSIQEFSNFKMSTNKLFDLDHNQISKSWNFINRTKRCHNDNEHWEFTYLGWMHSYPRWVRYHLAPFWKSRWYSRGINDFDSETKLFVSFTCDHHGDFNSNSKYGRN